MLYACFQRCLLACFFCIIFYFYTLKNKYRCQANDDTRDQKRGHTQEPKTLHILRESVYLCGYYFVITAAVGIAFSSYPTSFDWRMDKIS